MNIELPKVQTSADMEAEGIIYSLVRVSVGAAK